MSFFTGLLLGLSMILPIGPQNIYVLTHGIVGGWRRGLLAAGVAGFCDTVLIVVGGAGLAALLSSRPRVQVILLWCGAVFLFYLGISSLSAKDQTDAVTNLATNETVKDVWWSLALPGVGVSWGNPHAVLDTIVVLGSAISTHAAEQRWLFAGGTIAASWIYFTTLALAGAYFSTRIGALGRRRLRQLSGALMLVFAFVLGKKAIL